MYNKVSFLQLETVSFQELNAQKALGTKTVPTEQDCRSLETFQVMGLSATFRKVLRKAF